MSRMWTPVIIEVHPSPDARLRLRAGLPNMYVDALIFQRPLYAFDEDSVDTAPLAIHGYTDPAPLERVSPGEGRERAALIGVHDLRQPVRRLPH